MRWAIVLGILGGVIWVIGPHRRPPLLPVISLGAQAASPEPLPQLSFYDTLMSAPKPVSSQPKSPLIASSPKQAEPEYEDTGKSPQQLPPQEEPEGIDRKLLESLSKVLGEQSPPL